MQIKHSQLVFDFVFDWFPNLCDQQVLTKDSPVVIFFYMCEAFLLFLTTFVILGLQSHFELKVF